MLKIIFQHICVKKQNTKFHENPFSAIRVVIRETDRLEGDGGSILTAVVTNGSKFAMYCV